MPHLDADQAASFDRDGYLVLPGVFDVDEVAAMRADADFILELIVNSSLANDRQSRRLDIRRKLDGTMIDIRNGPNRLNESPWEWRYQRMRAAGEVVDSFRVAS